MIDTIDAQLCVWGKRQFASMRSGLGFPPYSPMFRDTPSGKGHGGNPPKGVALTGVQEMLDISAAVQQLDIADRSLVAETYIIGGPAVAVAFRMRIARRTYYDRLHAVHERIQAALHVMAIGA